MKEGKRRRGRKRKQLLNAI